MSKDDYTGEIKELAEKVLHGLLATNKTSELKQHFNNIEVISGTVQELKYKIQELMVSHNENMGKIDDFLENLDRDVAKFADILTRLDEAMQQIVDGENMKGKFRANEKEGEKFRLYEETEMRIQLKIDFENKEEKKLLQIDNPVKKKLPEFVISKFESTALYWFRFWNQFESEVDKQDISPVTECSYLTEFSFPQVRKPTVGLPFTSEGYFMAQIVLLAKFGKPRVVASALFKCVTLLLVVSVTHPNRIHDFLKNYMVVYRLFLP